MPCMQVHCITWIMPQKGQLEQGGSLSKALGSRCNTTMSSFVLRFTQSLYSFTLEAPSLAARNVGGLLNESDGIDLCSTALEAAFARCKERVQREWFPSTVVTRNISGQQSPLHDENAHNQNEEVTHPFRRIHPTDTEIHKNRQPHICIPCSRWHLGSDGRAHPNSLPC